MVLVVTLVWWIARPDPAGPTTSSVGAEAAEALAALPSSTSPAIQAPPSAPPAAPQVAEPVSIALPSLGLDAPVVPVGVEDDGLMEVPEDVRTVGWYRFGPAPGSAAGSAVLSGHVNDRTQGVGVFARIAELQIGDTVEVRLADGAAVAYRVVAREQWPKGEVPLDRLFDRGGSHRVVLITCGGVFDRGARNYEDNIAVTTVPA